MSWEMEEYLNGSAKGKGIGDVVTWGGMLSFCEIWSINSKLIMCRTM